VSDSHEQFYIHPRQLRVGMYVHLDLSWMQHPFPLSSFKIKDEAQLNAIQAIGLEQVRYDPLRSDCEPLPVSGEMPEPEPEVIQVITSLPEAEPIEEDKRKARVALLNYAIRECEKSFVKATNTARQAIQNITSSPQQAVVEADLLIGEMVKSILTEGGMVIQAMDGSRLGDDTYCHPLNSIVLAMMVAKAMSMSEEDAHCLGLAALFHDVGKHEVPDSILMNTGELSRAEQAFLQQHCEFGADIVLNAGISERVAQIIYQHHELADGSGYPRGLAAADIDPLARILSMVNIYDNLCNPVNVADAMTPYSALSNMFSNNRKRYDNAMLNTFIKALGVYPPGSIVLLNDGVYGIVMSVNPQKLLKPVVMLHNRRIERDMPDILDLGEETDTTISKCLHANQLPKDVADYLQCRQRLSYYFSKASFNDETQELENA
jgi:putative nucleotidyltransferase with HDIG domain